MFLQLLVFLKVTLSGLRMVIFTDNKADTSTKLLIIVLGCILSTPSFVVCDS